VFLYALMSYMATHRIGLLLTLSSGQSSAEPLSLRRLDPSASTHG
jgi:hypothetical protein